MLRSFSRRLHTTNADSNQFHCSCPFDMLFFWNASTFFTCNRQTGRTNKHFRREFTCNVWWLCCCAMCALASPVLLYLNKFEISCAHCLKSIGNYKVLKNYRASKKDNSRSECCRNGLIITTSASNYRNWYATIRTLACLTGYIQMTRVDISYSRASISCFCFFETQTNCGGEAVKNSFYKYPIS